MNRARLSGGIAAQAGRAALALATAALISSTVDNGNSAICSPVAGLNTGVRRSDAEIVSFPPTAFSIICMVKQPR
jgi:hypothetical protein